MNMIPQGVAYQEIRDRPILNQVMSTLRSRTTGVDRNILSYLGGHNQTYPRTRSRRGGKK